MQTYLHDPDYIFTRQVEADNANLPELIPPVPYKLIKKELEQLVKSIESDGKGLPVLVRQYAKPGAQFISIGSDIEFRKTPGMLLVVNTGELPSKTIQKYFVEGTKSYLNFKPVT